ncbi:hypothetical protein [Pistricoccus aurantiacus]|uniref:hypothetical protein n=1 Tax=Pistricoccus aurantiacus TaxID=1883414 RepID=UPI003624D4AB
MTESTERLASPDIDLLRDLILNSFRVRQNQDPVYVDISGNLGRVGAPQHQIIFGRRGSGKSCLFIHYIKTHSTDSVPPIYILADEFKRLTYPDVLIRLLIEILKGVPTKGAWWKKFLRIRTPTEAKAEELRALLDIAEEADITAAKKSSRKDAAKAGSGAGALKMEGRQESAEEQSRSASFREKKIDSLERHMRDFKDAIQASLKTWGQPNVVVLVDDFYLFPRHRQADILDYLHRLVRDTNLFLKIGTIRHRTTLIKNEDQTIGVELGQDIEEISLDRTLEDLDTTQTFLYQMLRTLAERAGITEVDTCFNRDALQALTLVSGGVPRDFLNIFVNAINAARGENNVRWLTPTLIYKGAGRLSYNQKLKNLKDDAGVDIAGLERVFVDLLKFCLKESRKTAFLISQEEAQTHRMEHDLIQQLMDFKLIHVVEPDTSAASGRPGRYEAYTLDFALFTEPRRRGIEIVEFWKIDDNRRRVGIREAPVYPLPRVKQVFGDGSARTNPEDEIHEILGDDVDSVGAQQSAAADALPSTARG